MGEIADALRRAREERGTPAETPPSAPQLPEPAPPAAMAAVPLPARHLPGPDPAAEGRVLDSLSPSDPAIVLAEGPSVEVCRHIAVRVRSELERRGARSVAIVSAVRDEGKTTVLCDLGIALASLSGSREVALVDLDLRKPSLARVLDVRASKGIDAVLAGRASLDEVRVSVRRPALDLYPAIEPRRNAHELLVLSRFARVIKELEQRHAIVLIDTPPTLIVPDTSLILQHVGACIPIARAGQTRARLFRQLIDVLPRGKLLGELLNGVRTPAHDFGYYYADDDGHTKPSRAPGVK